MGAAKISLKEQLFRKVEMREMPQSLNSEESFLISRLVNQKLSIKEIFPLCPWDEEKTLELLESLLARKVLKFAEAQQNSESQKNPLQQQLHEDEELGLADLDRDFRRDVIFKFQAISEKNPYTVLDLTKNASKHEIKVKYLELSRKYHPDRFFRKNLGHYREKLDHIFANIQKAYAVLRDEHEREVIDKMLSLKNQGRTKTKEEALKNLKALDPHFEINAKAEKSYLEGQEYEKKQDFISAYNCYALAAQTCPQREQYSKAVAHIKPLMQKQRAQEKLKQARDASGLRSLEELSEASAEALRFDPDLPEAQLLWAKSIIELRRANDYRTARERLLRSKAQLSKNAEPCYWLARLLILQGDKKAAKKELDEALKRDARHNLSLKLKDEIS